MTPEDFKIIVNGLVEDQVIYLKETDQSTDFPLCDWCFGLISALEVVGEEQRSPKVAMR
jgi:protein-disulfide isomerase-like protein with CxxC motif